MNVVLKDGTGSGKTGRITGANRVTTLALQVPHQMHVALVKEQAYQVQGSASPNNNTEGLLHLKNTSESLYLIITYIRAQFYDFAGGTAVPNAATYFDYGHGQTYTSGGTAATPINTNAGSSNAAAVTAYDSSAASLVMGGTFSSLDTYHVKEEAEMVVWRKEGSIVITPGKTFTLRITTDHTSGVAYGRVSFLMVDPDEL